MATDKTPPERRIERAEKSAAEWKLKAIERREEIERLNLRMKGIEEKVSELINKFKGQDKQIESFENQLKNAHLIIANLQSENEELKKKLILRRFKTI